MRSFLDIAHPDWNSTLITTGFEFDPKKLHGKEGFPAEAKRRRVEAGKEASRWSRELQSLGKWADNATAQDAEYQVIKMLERLFASQVATIISGYKETCLGSIVKCLTPSGHNHDMPLSQEVNNHLLP